MHDKTWCPAYRQVYASSNEYGIPDLLPQKPMTPMLVPRRTAITAGKSGPGTLAIYRSMQPAALSVIGFWVDDYRFENLWTRPAESIANLKCFSPAALVEPDFSQYAEMPKVACLWNHYRSRWVARYWQDRGMTVIPNLSWSPKTIDLCSVGIPRGSLVACEARPRFRDTQTLLDGLSIAVSDIQPPTVLLYGAPLDLLERMPAGPEYIRLEAWSPRKRGAKDR